MHDEEVHKTRTITVIYFKDIYTNPSAETENK